jgi:hypothetical protein
VPPSGGEADKYNLNVLVSSGYFIHEVSKKTNNNKKTLFI